MKNKSREDQTISTPHKQRYTVPWVITGIVLCALTSVFISQNSISEDSMIKFMKRCLVEQPFYTCKGNYEMLAALETIRKQK